MGNAMRFACIAKLCTVASKLHSIYMNWEVGLNRCYSLPVMPSMSCFISDEGGPSHEGGRECNLVLESSIPACHALSGLMVAGGICGL